MACNIGVWIEADVWEAHSHCVTVYGDVNCGIHSRNGANGLLANVPIFIQLNIHMLTGGTS